VQVHPFAGRRKKVFLGVVQALKLMNAFVVVGENLCGNKIRIIQHEFSLVRDVTFDGKRRAV
jgi:hypothetical protein